jgi:hypothetical protein
MILKVVNDENIITKNAITHNMLLNRIVLAKMHNDPNNIYQLHALYDNNTGIWYYHWFMCSKTGGRWNNRGYELESAIVETCEIRIMDTIDEMCKLLRDWK